MPLPGARQLCGARTRKGTPCQNAAMENGRCRMHGGKVPRGAELPQFAHGRYSKSMPDRLAERYEEALSDEERHDLRDEIALAETKIADLLASIERSADESLAWQDVERWIARKQRAVESDVRVATIKQQMMSVEEVMALVAGILDAIRRHVKDETTRRALGRDIRALGTSRKKEK